MPIGSSPAGHGLVDLIDGGDRRYGRPAPGRSNVIHPHVLQASDGDATAEAVPAEFDQNGPGRQRELSARTDYLATRLDQARPARLPDSDVAILVVRMYATQNRTAAHRPPTRQLDRD